MTTEPDKNKSTATYNLGLMALVALVLGVYIMCSFYASHLSWKCNVDLKTHHIVKIIAVIGAFLSGPFYVFYYMVTYHAGLCYFASQLNAGALPGVVASTAAA